MRKDDHVLMPSKAHDWKREGEWKGRGNDTQGRESAWEAANNTGRRVKYWGGERMCSWVSTLALADDHGVDGCEPA